MRKILVLAAALILSACVMVVVAPDQDLPEEVNAALAKSNQMTLYSLEPDTSKTAQGEKLHGYLVLGKTELNPEQSREAVQAIQTGMEDWDGSVSKCHFSPRHALRASYDGHSYDFLICYKCGQLDVFKDDKEIAWRNITGSPDALKDLLQ